MVPSVVRLAALWIGLTGPPGESTDPRPGDLPAQAIVTTDDTEMLASPEDEALALGRLAAGTPVRVVDIDNERIWATIAPAPGTFVWVEQSGLKPSGPDHAIVGDSGARLRAGIEDARLPGPPLGRLSAGTNVVLVDRKPVTTGVGTSSSVWIAIKAPESAVRYVRLAALRWYRSGTAPSKEEGPADVRKAAYQDVGNATLPEAPAEVAAEVARIESDHRAILAGPIEEWRLETVRSRYEALLKHANDPAAKAAVQARLDLVTSHEAIGRSARTIQTILERSRRRDAVVEATRRDLASIDEPRRRPFVARGLIQPSSRQVDGRRVYALIGPEGRAVAYLDVPPGLDARQVLAKQVGVRGNVSYSEALGSRLIAVRDIEALE
ncbi:MAG: hypothetical protein U0794_22435 [Isosphaeraceae bacterium]